MRRLVATLACRNAGSRLYGKPIQNLSISKGITVLKNIVDCLSNNNSINEIALAIAEGDENLAFIEFAKNNELKYVIGDEIDVLYRLIQCGCATNATDIFRVTSESPFPFYEQIDSGWSAHCLSNFDATFMDGIIDGCGFEIIKLDALKKSHNLGGNKHRSELCSLYIREHKSDFKIQYLNPPEVLMRKDIRLTVDYPEDLIVCRAIYKQFESDAPMINLESIVKYLDENNYLKEIISPFCEQGYKTMYI